LFKHVYEYLNSEVSNDVWLPFIMVGSALVLTGGVFIFMGSIFAKPYAWFALITGIVLIVGSIIGIVKCQNQIK